MKKEIIKDLVIILVTCLVTLGGSYVAFAQKVAKLEEGKADIEQIAQVSQSVADINGKVSEFGVKIDGNTAAQQQLGVKVDKSAEKNEKAIEELRKQLLDKLEKDADKRDKVIEDMRKQMQESSKKEAQDMGELKGKLEMLIKALSEQ